MNEDARRTRNCGIAKGASTARLAGAALSGHQTPPNEDDPVAENPKEPRS